MPGMYADGTLLWRRLSIVLDTVPPLLDPLDGIESVLLVLTCVLLSRNMSASFLNALHRLGFG
tara:strand:+ start:8072 stop:8260 length:189 start_codon:yes stop_codon:yes gene_type:complete